MPTPRLFTLDANQVAGTLYQGSLPRIGRDVGRVLHCLVYAAEECQPPRPRYPTIRVLRARLDDNPDGVRPSDRKEIVATAIKLRKRLDGGQIALVTCYAGLNRSGVISALTLMLPSNGMSFTPGCLTAHEAIRLVRNARGPRALSNPAFVALLYELECLCPSRKYERRV